MTLSKPQETRVVGNVSKIVKENFTARVVSEGESPLCIQNGAVYTDSGKPIETIPDWVWEAYAKMSPETQEKLGLKRPGK